MGTPVSPPVIRGWLVKNGFALHKMAKVLAGGRSPFRNAQFEKINDFKHQYFQASNPVFSIDTKAKEFLGQFYRAGRVWTQKATRALGLAHQQVSEVVRIAEIPNRVGDPRRINH